jgi:hypothetical protein
LKKHAVFL